MVSNKNKTQGSRQLTWIGGAIIILVIIMTALGSWLLYEHTVNLLTDNLRQRLLSIAITEVANIDAKDVSALQTEEDWKKPEWSRVVHQLKKAKDTNSNIVFMYIFRKVKNDPSKMEFVADAESINPYANTDNDPSNDVDANKDGKVEPDGADQLQWPGQEYPTPPAEAFDAYKGPLTNHDLYSDAYGSVLTGYAPIKDASGQTVAVLGTDIKADDFFTVTRETLYPFLLFINFLVLTIVILAIAIIKIWNKRVDVLAELDTQKDDILNMVTHEFRTPVTRINSYAELLLDGTMGQLTPEQKESISTILDASHIMGDETEMILAAAKIKLGKLPLHPQPLDLNAFFAEIARSAEQQAKEQNVGIALSIPANLPTAPFDMQYMRLALNNLISNAIKYTSLRFPKGEGKVEFSVEIKDKALIFKAKDNGVGIPEDAKGKIFKEQMYRAKNSGTKGNGLGLYATMGIIKAAGGDIWYESKENEGTTFFVKLPLNA